MARGYNFDFKVIRDPVHGYISLSELEYKILQTPTFNRLHRIKTNGIMYLVFPGAQSTRFSHCIGTMHLASKMSLQLLKDAKKLKICTDIFGNLNDTKEEELIQIVRLAALLHDVGHGPFSHVSEEILVESMSNEEKDEAIKLFNKSREDIPSHEYFTYKLITNGEINEIIEEDHPGLSNAIASLIIKNEKYISNLLGEQATHLFRKIISSYVDADRLDNLLRDSYFIGPEYGKIDIGRIINNLSIIYINNRYDVGFYPRAINVLEDMIDARFKMYKWIYNHHLVAISKDLLNFGLRALIKENIIKREDFNWRNYSSSDILANSEEYLLYLVHTLTKKEEYAFLKGLFDRRYLPVSLIKNKYDQDEFTSDILSYVAKEKYHIAPFDLDQKIIDEIKIEISSKIENWIKENYEKKQFLTGKDDIIIFPVIAGYKPYRGLEDEFIFINSGKNPIQIREISDYFNKINTEMQNYPNFFIFYTSTKNNKKEENRKDKDEILNSISKHLANLILRDGLE